MLRAEATRQALMDDGVSIDQFARIEGVADRQPYVPDDIYDPRNRRMSITLAWETQDHNDPSAAMRDSIGASLNPDKMPAPH